MKNKVFFLLLSAFAFSCLNVSGAVAKVPATTITEGEKAPAFTGGNADGAITLQVTPVCYAILEEPLTVSKCCYCVDENFYRNGYKAKLSTAVVKVFSPPKPNHYRHYRTARDGFTPRPDRATA